MGGKRYKKMEKGGHKLRSVKQKDKLDEGTKTIEEKVLMKLNGRK